MLVHWLDPLVDLLVYGNLGLEQRCVTHEMLDHYEAMQPQDRAIVALVRVYWPAS